MFLKPTEIRDFVWVLRAPIGNAVQFGEMFKSDDLKWEGRRSKSPNHHEIFGSHGKT